MLEFNISENGNTANINPILQWEVRFVKNSLWAAAWHPYGKYIALAINTMIAIIFANTGCEILRFKTTHKKSIRKISWDRTGKLLSTCSFDGTVSIFIITLGDSEKSRVRIFLLDSLDGHNNEVKSCTFHNSKNLIATCSRDRSVWIWEYFIKYLANNQQELYQECTLVQSTHVVDQIFTDLLGSINFHFHTECVAVLEDHTQDVKSVKWAGYDDELISCGYDNTIKAWGCDLEAEQEDWSLKETLIGHTSTVWDTSIHHSSPQVGDAESNRNLFLASVGANMNCLLWLRVNEKAQPNRWKSFGKITNLHHDSILSCEISSAAFLLTSSVDSSICITDISSIVKDLQVMNESTIQDGKHLKHVRICDAHCGSITCSAWKPTDNTSFFSCGEDGFLRMWTITL